MNMFDFLMDAGNYSERKVDNFENEDCIIDTCAVSDGNKPYETGIQHILYNNNQWVIVEAYNSKDEAQIGHDKWVKIMTSENLPDTLKDCQNAGIAGFLDAEDMVFKKQAI